MPCASASGWNEHGLVSSNQNDVKWPIAGALGSVWNGTEVTLYTGDQNFAV